MAIYDEAIRNAMRERIIGAGIFTDKDFKFENKNFNSTGKKIWISEAWIGGDEQLFTNRSTQMPTALVQYDIYVPEDSGTLMAGQASHAIEDEFSIISPTKSRIVVPSIPEMEVSIYRTGLSTRTENTWFVQIVLLYLRITQRYFVDD